MNKLQNRHHQNPHRSQAGETLIEVVVATLVFAVGLLGNLGLQSASVQSNKSSLHQTKAILAVNDIAERIRANRDAALEGSYSGYKSTAPPSNPGCTDQPCDAEDIAQYHLYDWSQNFSNVYGDDNFLKILPGGQASIAFDGATNEYIIEISWIEQAYAETATGSERSDRRRTHELVLTI